MNYQVNENMQMNDIYEEYLNDPYENRPKNFSKTQDLNTFDAYFYPNSNYMNINETVNLNNNNYNSNKMSSNEVAQISTQTVNEIKAANVDKKKLFAEKLRQNASKKLPRKNTIQQGDENYDQKSIQKSQSRMSKKSKNSRRRAQSSDSSYSSSSYTSSTSSSRSRSLTPPPRKPSKPYSSKRNSSQLKIDTSKEKIVPPLTPPKPKYSTAEQAEKLRNYQFQGFHPYYDKEADVLGLACCTCCISKCKTKDNGCRGCANLISCPVYCWLLAILPTLILLIAGIIILGLVGAKIIK